MTTPVAVTEGHEWTQEMTDDETLVLECVRYYGVNGVGDAAMQINRDRLRARLAELRSALAHVDAVRKERDVFKQTAAAQLAVASQLAAEATETRDVLRRVKNLVCGEKNPRWADDWSTTNTRMSIANLCDSILEPVALRSTGDREGGRG